MSVASVRVEAEIRPTEDPEKVRRAILNIFPGASVRVERGEPFDLAVAEMEGTNSLAQLRNLLRMQRIRDAANAILRSCIADNRLVFYLNKQVAFVRKVSFSEPTAESPLGPIKVTITCDDPEALVDWLAPRTARSG